MGTNTKVGTQGSSLLLSLPGPKLLQMGRFLGNPTLTPKGARERPPFNEIRARVVSPRIFVRCQRLMARKIAELFGLNRGVRPFYAVVASMS